MFSPTHSLLEMFVRGNVLSRTMEDAIRLAGPVFYEAIPL